MIDIHTHVLPGIDDGSPAMEVSVEMLWQAYDTGTRGLVLTPHCNVPGMFENYNYHNAVLKRIETFMEEVRQEKIPVRLFPGMEVFGTRDTGALLREGRFLTLNQTRYLLIEFPFSGEASYVTGILEDILEQGYRPVIAHPERYSYVQQEPFILDRWIRMGCVTQINKGSISGRFGSEPEHCAWELLRRGMVACVASDAHHSHWRSPMMDETAYLLERSFDQEYASYLLHHNPSRILKGQEPLWPQG